MALFIIFSMPNFVYSFPYNFKKDFFIQGGVGQSLSSMEIDQRAITNNKQYVRNNTIDLGIGYHWNKRIALELAFSHTAGKASFTNDYQIQFISPPHIIRDMQRYEVKESSNILFSNAYWSFYNSNKAKLYLLGGVGLGLNRLSYYYHYIDINTLSIPPISSDILIRAKQKKIRCAQQLGMGASKSLNKDFDLYASYKVMYNGVKKYTPEDNQIQNGQPTPNDNFYTYLNHNIIMGIRYKF